MKSQFFLLTWSFVLVTSRRVNPFLAGATIRGILPQFKGLKHANLNLANKHYNVLDTIGLIERHGYPAEGHTVKTDDGYELKIFRIPGNRNSSKSDDKPVVFLQHGFLWSSDAFVLIGPDHDLSYMLADAGYDVWIGNVRGNTYGKSHRTVKPIDAEFWDFSYHEMGMLDLPSMIDHVLGITGQKTLYFVGHSMGATIAYVMLSMRPEYNEKIRLLISLAPVTIWKHKPNTMQELFKKTGFLMRGTFRRGGINEILPQNTFMAAIADQWCREDVPSHETCLNMIFGIVGEDREQLNTTLLSYLFLYYPASTSRRTLEHFHQNMLSGKFQQYDFNNSKTNLKKYKQTSPPTYSLQKVTAPVALIYGKNDAIVTAEEMYELKKHFINITTLEAVPYRKFNHMDFIWARDVKDLLYKRILELIQQN